jgi:hypothetical protein
MKMPVISRKAVWISVVTLVMYTIAEPTSEEPAVAESVQEPDQACSLSILDPAPGTLVGAAGTVSGTASLSANSHLWILAHKKAFIGGWWPQGGGETPITNGHWEVAVTYGIDIDEGNFEIAAEAVGNNVNDDLNNWVASAPSKSYPPIGFPAAVNGCPIAKVIVVKK